MSCTLLQQGAPLFPSHLDYTTSKGGTSTGKYDAQTKWAKENADFVGLKLYHSKDAQIIKWLSEQPSKQGAIKCVLREHIARVTSEGESK